MLTITNLHRSFAGQTVLAGANWSIPAGTRVGLVGANGSGKSTLLRLIAGLDQPDTGTITLSRGATVGYLPQHVASVAGRTVLDSALEAFAGVRALEDECRALERDLERLSPNDPGYSDVMDAYASARERWDHEGGYDLESQVRTVLAGLGFREADFARDAGEFSGGWQMRLALARLLLRRPTFLLLDEPTNHLDLEARNWLEQFLGDYPHTVILVAHDRYFMDVTVRRITEVARGKLTDYHTAYSRYLVEREERRARERASYETQQTEIERIEAFISRFRYQASKAALVQSRIKQLEKIDRLPPPEGGSTRLAFRFPPCERSGRTVLSLEGAVKRYGEVRVYDGLDLTIERGRRVALVGPNGAGKSTLIRILAGIEPLTAGKRRVGHRVTFGYFAQDQWQELAPDRTVLDEATEAAPYDMVPRLRQLLGAFLFGGESVHKPVKVLSGGERNRLALAKLLLQPLNCLLLDEPTNHLDLTAKGVLLDALRHYEGTIVIVAHDRYLLDHLPDEIIEVGSGRAVRYLGNYEDYLRKKADGTSPPPAPTASGSGLSTNRPAEAAAEQAGTRDHRDAQRTAKRQTAAAARRMREVARVEAAIAEAEEEYSRVAAAINAPDFYQTHADPHSLFSRYAELKKEIDRLYGRLERLEAATSVAAPA